MTDSRYYSGKYRWIKVGFVAVAILIILFALFMLRQFVNSMSEMERKRVDNWATATRLIGISDTDDDLTLELKVINDNTDIPVILADEKGNYIDGRNLNMPDDAEERHEWIKNKEKEWGRERAPIEIEMTDGSRQYVYYDESNLVFGMRIFTIGALSIIAIFTLILLLFLLNEWRARQNTVWVGFSKETAHQLGTPISSLSAWIELFKLRNPAKEDMVKEMEKDVDRLKIIAERFSKIGSKPKLETKAVQPIVEKAVSYMRGRVSKHIDIEMNSELSESFCLPINDALIEWVIENLCKNAVDSMSGRGGKIDIYMMDRDGYCEIDISDTGCGIARSKRNMIFKSGYTTKSRGWGLGLSFARRIVEEYHNGKIYVKNSEEGRGTTFAIMLFASKEDKYRWSRKTMLMKIGI